MVDDTRKTKGEPASGRALGREVLRSDPSDDSATGASDGFRITEKAKQLGVTLTKLGSVVDIDPSQMSKIARDLRKLSPEKLAFILSLDKETSDAAPPPSTLVATLGSASAGRRLRAIRMKRGYKLVRFAQLLGMSSPHLVRMEKGLASRGLIQKTILKAAKIQKNPADEVVDARTERSAAAAVLLETRLLFGKSARDAAEALGVSEKQYKWAEAGRASWSSIRAMTAGLQDRWSADPQGEASGDADLGPI